jgi:CYTH domain-containing protein
MEIERKYLVKYLPENLEQYQKRKIIQGYLSVNPVVRIRKSNEDYILTYKSLDGINKKDDNSCVCNEIEMPLNEKSFNHLLNKCDGSIIEKTRYLIKLNDKYTAELDVFESIYEGLVVVEVEFDSEEDIVLFEKPDWFGENISADKRYGNNFLATIKNRQEFEQIFLRMEERL